MKQPTAALPALRLRPGRYNVELIGAKLASINKAEDRDLFAQVRQLCLNPKP